MDAKINNSTFIRNTTLYLQKCELQNKICNVLLFVYRIFFITFIYIILYFRLKVERSFSVLIGLNLSRDVIWDF